jgi:hypothetical protein
MASRLYIVPVVGSGNGSDSRRPKYFNSDANGTGTVGIVSGPWSAMEYGFEPWMCVGANLSAADHSTIAAKTDVSALPVTLTATLTAPQVTATQTFLENCNIPAGWVSTTLTWVQVLRVVLGIFSFFQRLGAVYLSQMGTVPGSIFNGGVTLNTTFSALPLAVRNALTATAADQGISTAGITATTTVRVMLKTLGDAYSQRSLTLGGVVI